MNNLLNLFLNILGFSIILTLLMFMLIAVIFVISLIVYFLRELFFPPNNTEHTHE